MFKFILLITAIVLVSIDFIYLNFLKSYYFEQIKKVQGNMPKINYLGVVLCYIFLIVGINYFIIKSRKNISDAFLLGMVIYGVYNTSNYAIFDNWSIFTVILDTLWGGILFGSTSYIVKFFQ